MVSYSGKTVFITGASAGIGAEMARQFADLGADVALSARRVDRLEALADEVRQRGRKALALECDVARDGDLERAAAAAREAFGRIDVVVANAGFGVTGDLESLELDDYRRQFETNVFGVLRTAYATLEDLKKTRGQFVVIGSVIGHFSLPRSSPYSMSKFAMRALTQSLYGEWREHGIDVTLIEPGFVASEFRQVDNLGDHHPDARDKAPKRLVVSTPKAVGEIIRAVSKRRREAVITGHGRWIVRFHRLAPRLFFALMGRAKIKHREQPK